MVGSKVCRLSLLLLAAFSVGTAIADNNPKLESHREHAPAILSDNSEAVAQHNGRAPNNIIQDPDHLEEKRIIARSPRKPPKTRHTAKACRNWCEQRAECAMALFDWTAYKKKDRCQYIDNSEFKFVNAIRRQMIQKNRNEELIDQDFVRVFAKNSGGSTRGQFYISRARLEHITSSRPKDRRVVEVMEGNDGFIPPYVTKHLSWSLATSTLKWPAIYQASTAKWTPTPSSTPCASSSSKMVHTPTSYSPKKSSTPCSSTPKWTPKPTSTPCASKSQWTTYKKPSSTPCSSSTKKAYTTPCLSSTQKPKSVTPTTTHKKPTPTPCLTTSKKAYPTSHAPPKKPSQPPTTTHKKLNSSTPCFTKSWTKPTTFTKIPMYNITTKASTMSLPIPPKYTWAPSSNATLPAYVKTITTTLPCPACPGGLFTTCLTSTTYPQPSGPPPAAPSVEQPSPIQSVPVPVSYAAPPEVPSGAPAPPSYTPEQQQPPLEPSQPTPEQPKETPESSPAPVPAPVPTNGTYSSAAPYPMPSQFEGKAAKGAVSVTTWGLGVTMGFWCVVAL